MGQIKIGLAFSAIFAMAWAANVVSAQRHAAEHGVPHCPVMSDEVIDITRYIDTPDGQRIYFCCEGCPKKYNKNPGKYSDRVKAQQRMLKDIPQVQVTCPVSGKAVDKTASIEHEGRTIYFCCPKCPSAFKSSPGQYKTKLAACYTFQTTCPVSDKPVNPESFTTLADGQRVYFCSAGCNKDFQAEPRKFGADLPSFYLCPMDVCKDAGTVVFDKCPTCGMRRKQIGTGIASEHSD